MAEQEGSLGKAGFIAQHGLYSDEQVAQAEALAARVRELDLETVRVAWTDQHGILRGKHVMARDFPAVLANGLDFQTATLFMDTTNNLFAPIFERNAGMNFAALAGGPDAILVPDPGTFRVLPWAERSGWVLAEMYLADGTPCPFDSRQVLRRQLDALARRGLSFMAGLEVEFYITKLEDRMLEPAQAGYPPDPPRVSVIAHGFQYLTEDRQDEIDHILVPLQRHLEAIGLPLRTMEDEWGPGQCEFTFDPELGLTPADHMVLFRSATKQVCRRMGYHATFMTRPALPNFFSSGWHLHMSLIDAATRTNLFADPAEPLSPLGRQFVAGLLEHAAAACVFAAPTINGYKRFRPNSFAPDRITWAVENRAAMLRVVGGPGDPGTHIENRAGEPCANPYLYMAAQIAAGLDGIERALDPGPPERAPYEAEKPLLPRSLMEATAALRASPFYREAFGAQFVDYILAVKQSEIDRFLAHVTDWEQREYFEVY
ncbi:MAG: glutamine synthetase [Gammaproteobacteria bacterium]|nr:glutamine synthetase [Gammaproteobacteria bacterium]